MPGIYSPSIDKGETWTRVVTWEDSAGNPVNLTGFTGKMQIRSGSSLLVELNTTNGKMTLGGAAGTITLTLSSSDTLALAAGNAKYDLFVTSSGGLVTKLLEGEVVVIDNVTVLS